jgi:Leucine-rich repeat (LRR) protein
MDDCFTVMFIFLDVDTLMTCFLVNKKFYALSHQDGLWQQHLKDTWFPCQKDVFNHYQHSFQCQQFLKSPFKQRSFQLIETLNLSYQKISYLLPALNVLKNLKTIFLSHNNITTLPPEWDMPLQTIYLNHNDITTLPPEWSVMPLQYINLSDNQITTLPAEWSSIMSLQTIYLNNNEITTLPPEWAVMPLQRIDLSHNHITTLPDEWSVMPLQWIDLSHNHITTLPPEWSVMPLQWIDLRNNHITALLSE